MARKSKTSGAASQAQGFGEAPQAAFFALDEATPGFGVSNRLRLTLGPGGRVVIPAALREAMEVNEGDALLAWIEDGELLKGLLPEGESLADELIADRRREAAAESRG